MKKDLFLKLIEEQTTDDGVNYDEVFEGVTKAINDTIVGSQEKLQAKAYDLAKENVVKELKLDGVENFNQLKAHISSLSANEDAQQLIQVQSEFQKTQAELEEAKRRAMEFQGKLNQYENERFLMSKGAQPEMVEFLSFKISKMTDEEVSFEEALEQFAQENKQYFEPTTPVVEPKVKTTGVPRKPQSDQPEISAVERILMERGKL
jgi:DNA repair exonuclease SbcCD ATPase subunit